ncbi:putative aldouronate transport system permease protein [Paenibacillus rhizosphaerae]|uniref:Putative aldouronate transport system permease protein n=1 Tax=Paenibacillus rhizosphaerae TaxID=297318 RepID=A0A839TMU6_9BACL|nr:carbohydrate ABC transporter permease [Paenibacillus rhizosphaerae]MBB3127050.1 putative aldouronate transport system permease protein [Paenibacillus rhizosphaerae]
MKLSFSDRALSVFSYIAVAALSFLTLYPFWNSIVISFNTGSDTMLGGLTFWPRHWTLENYEIILKNKSMYQAVLISVLRTAIGTALAIFLTSLFAYGLSKKFLAGRKFYFIVAIITMYFSGGLIPTFLWFRELHLYDSFWVLVLPGMVNVYYMLIFRTFFSELPDGLEESAKIDGCTDFGIFFRIVLHVSGPILATISLFTAVGLWNEWFTASIYINNQSLLPLQTYLINAMNSSLFYEQMTSALNSEAMKQMSQQTITAKALQMSTLVIATMPIIMVYPFVQKYFVKGVLVGSIKG